MSDQTSQPNPLLAMDNQLDVETTIIIALRDVAGIALKNVSAATYKDTLRLAERLSPYLFHRDRSLLQREWETPEEKLCNAIAHAQSISFEEAVGREINRYEHLLANSTGKDASIFRDKIEKLQQIFQENRTDRFYEGRLIARDASLGSKLPISREGNGYHDFALPANRGMRVRVTHETEIESITGTDLIYEHHEVAKRRARIVVVQYKIMEKERYVSKSSKLESQVNRMNQTFCAELPCRLAAQDNSLFRLPTCSAFLRSTNRLQSSNPTIMSTGFYVPICRISQIWHTRQNISENTFEGELIRYRVFEELFNYSSLGSRWLDYEELEEFYKKYKVLQSSDTVVMHCQVYE